MTPEEFFEEAKAGWYIRYAHRHVRIEFVSRVCEYAIGREVGSRRKVTLILEKDMLKECGYGCFNSLEVTR